MCHVVFLSVSRGYFMVCHVGIFWCVTWVFFGVSRGYFLVCHVGIF